MNNIRLNLFILVSMIFTVVELTVDPALYVGRIFLAVSAFSFFAFAMSFIKENWRYDSPKSKRE
ncbi:hypothetical protein [Companilactobacillus sp.]|uniref:hypothetical protein n=1 Tax=Companilactobacillus sp. TaxID=2767905 RepID=UPI0025BE114B|nr:hypothetical protein [Companilactobacillus sp.]MCH4009839.1 hypothetical protein [Companilactobacillus sp.]MCH4052485.1 hypothetical protein [Companilactobacillus sp.]MCH4077781.1 hypothetical protein [Companilactobacillus sp.]MCH4126357.1 hypothetical protein [Companilactobacillus sp.]MCI1312065.1 hypothetical protein [Companilactobacillus sp.]